MEVEVSLNVSKPLVSRTQDFWEVFDVMNLVIQPRRFTVTEYHRMSDLGILPPEERTELLYGQILPMIAKGTAHRTATTRIMRVFQLRLVNRAIIQVQDPIHLSDDSEPEPDIALLALDPLEYASHHATPAEIHLVIEVADSSLNYDLQVKVPAYAAAGIEECWVLDVQKRQLYVFRQPRVFRQANTPGYQQQMILADSLEADSLEVAPLAFEDCVVAVRDLLPPVGA